MDKKKIKRVVAREGLIILSIIVLGIINWMISSNFTYNNLMSSTIPTLLIFSYPIYWIIRFIIWAVNTLREHIESKLLKRNLKILGTVFLLAIIILLVYLYSYHKNQYPIDLVKNKLQYNEPKSWVESVKGDISIIGWEARELKKPNSYLVSYIYKNADNATFQLTGWWWEVDTKERIVRMVTNDPELEKKYGFKQVSKEIETNQEPKEIVIKQEVRKADLIENWRKLQKGLSQDEVRDLLGEPNKVDATRDYDTEWYYNKGYVEFSYDKVNGWREW